MELPLLQRAEAGDNGFHLSTEVTEQRPEPVGVIPVPGPGEQYRFHFDMTRCIGCKCCVVACNEQNGNPADILWRRVGEIEGGVYPQTKRMYLSMGCNHCLEPTCMTGCPVDAYSKDGLTGIVRHSADACIGCQYCTWNCSYGVPQYNPERGVVGKCDMCYGRLMDGDQPACSNACPENAIQIEVVRVDEWRADYATAANSPGMPSADHSISTTRITQPETLPRSVNKVDLGRFQVEAPHWPLVFMTVLTQLSVGAFAAIWLGGSASRHRFGGFIALAIAAVALTASTLHLGRPIHALRALRMWRRSWLSREVLLFTLFAIVATCYAAVVFFNLSGTSVLGCMTTLTGLAGVGASARLYMVPGRPSWNTLFTPAEFLLTTLLFGSLSHGLLTGSRQHLLLPIIGLLVFLLYAARLLWLSRAEQYELKATLRLLSTVLATRLMTRFALLGLSLILFHAASGTVSLLALSACMVASEILGRLLFFLSVVPTNMAAEYLAAEAAA